MAKVRKPLAHYTRYTCRMRSHSERRSSHDRQHRRHNQGYRKNQKYTLHFFFTSFLFSSSLAPLWQKLGGEKASSLERWM